MKLKFKVSLALAGVLVFGVVLALRPSDKARKALEETRTTLRSQGFKLDPAEFSQLTTPEMEARADALSHFGQVRSAAFTRNNPSVLRPIGSNAAQVVWKQEKLPAFDSDDLWPQLRDICEQNREALDNACQAARSGPICAGLTPPNAAFVAAPRVSMRALGLALAARTVLELRDQHFEAAWTNVLAMSSLVQNWQPLPTEIEHLLRVGVAQSAFNASWQALQASGWGDAQLAELQHTCESTHFMTGLPETAAYARASTAVLLENARQRPVSPAPPLSQLAAQLIQSPAAAWDSVTGPMREQRYLHSGSFEDERAVLLFYRDWELELRKATNASCWSELRAFETQPFPGMPNNSSRVSAILSMRTTGAAFRAGRSFLARIAEAETMRRLSIAAIAIERYRLRHGEYPKQLAQLVPELLNSTPTDFMDGEPLRYRLEDDGRFVLYSVGLDCRDNGGLIPRRPPGPRLGANLWDNAEGTDLVWPKPASQAEVDAVPEEERSTPRPRGLSPEQMEFLRRRQNQ